MNNEVRRKDRQISEQEAREILLKGEYGFLATVNENNTPYVIPVSYTIDDDSIFFHCARKGKKLDNILQNSNVCFSVVGNTQPIFDKNFTTYYESVVVFGKVYQVKDEAIKSKALYSLCEKYLPEHMDKAEKYINQSFNATLVFQITIDTITGKAKRQQ